MNILITGGLGYVGSHLAATLGKKNEIIIVDNLSNSKISILQKIEKILKKKIFFYKNNISQEKIIKKILSKHKIETVIHLASLKSIPDSILNKKKYMNNNFLGTKNLVNAMIYSKVKKLIFSSTAAVYGKPKYLPIDEKHKINILNPYAHTKILIEKYLKKISKQNKDFRVINFRYFNPAGSHSSNLIGDNPKKPQNLFPSINYAIKKKKFFKINGSDYKTKDGSPVRDFIHILDLCDAHLKCILKINSLKGYQMMNIGSGRGFTVLEILKEYEKILKKNIKYKFSNRRVGDVAKIFTSFALIKEKLSWTPKRSLKLMCESSYNFSRKR